MAGAINAPDPHLVKGQPIDRKSDLVGGDKLGLHIGAVQASGADLHLVFGDNASGCRGRPFKGHVIGRIEQIFYTSAPLDQRHPCEKRHGEAQPIQSCLFLSSHDLSTFTLLHLNAFSRAQAIFCSNTIIYHFGTEVEMSLVDNENRRQNAPYPQNNRFYGLPQPGMGPHIASAGQGSPHITGRIPHK